MGEESWGLVSPYSGPGLVGSHPVPSDPGKTEWSRSGGFSPNGPEVQWTRLTWWSRSGGSHQMVQRSSLTGSSGLVDLTKWSSPGLAGSGQAVRAWWGLGKQSRSVESGREGQGLITDWSGQMVWGRAYHLITLYS